MVHCEKTASIVNSEKNWFPRENSDSQLKLKKSFPHMPSIYTTFHKNRGMNGNEFML